MTIGVVGAQPGGEVGRPRRRAGAAPPGRRPCARTRSTARALGAVVGPRASGCRSGGAPVARRPRPAPSRGRGRAGGLAAELAQAGALRGRVELGAGDDQLRPRRSVAPNVRSMSCWARTTALSRGRSETSGEASHLHSGHGERAEQAAGEHQRDSRAARDRAGDAVPEPSGAGARAGTADPAPVDAIPEQREHRGQHRDRADHREHDDDHRAERHRANTPCR